VHRQPVVLWVLCVALRRKNHYLRTALAVCKVKNRLAAIFAGFMRKRNKLPAEIIVLGGLQP
jgi:hypothetical protein